MLFKGKRQKFVMLGPFIHSFLTRIKSLLALFSFFELPKWVIEVLDVIVVNEALIKGALVPGHCGQNKVHNKGSWLHLFDTFFTLLSPGCSVSRSKSSPFSKDCPYDTFKYIVWTSSLVTSSSQYFRIIQWCQDPDSLLVKRRNDNHSPGPVIRELVPSSHQRSELGNTILCIFSR